MSNYDDLSPLPLDPRPGRYRHYKGNEYLVISLARHSETLEVFVIYKPLYGEGAHWIRPQKMFLETIMLNGQQIPRFARIGDA